MQPAAMMAPAGDGAMPIAQQEMQAGVPTGAPGQPGSVTGDPNLDAALQQIMLVVPDDQIAVVEQLLAAMEPYLMPAQAPAMDPASMAMGMQTPAAPPMM